MKQNTRIEKLMHSKRMRKIVNVATVAMLVCPLAIGAVNALANTEDVTDLAVTEIASTEETAVSEAQPTVESTDLPVESTEPLWSESSESTPSSTEEQTETPNTDNPSSEVEENASSTYGEYLALDQRREDLVNAGADFSGSNISELKNNFLNAHANYYLTGIGWEAVVSALKAFEVEVIRLENENKPESAITGYTFSADKTTVKRGELASFTLVAHHADGTDSNVKIGTDGTAILSVGGVTTDSLSFQMNFEPGTYEAKAFSYGGANDSVQLGETILITVVGENSKPEVIKLQEVYDKYKALSESDYHPTDWKVFKQRIANDTDLVSLTESILTKPNQEVTDEVVSDLVSRWQSHLSWLTPELKLLQAEYDKYLALVESDYTSSSWQAFQEYLKNNPVVGYTEIALDEESIANGLTVESPRFTIDRWQDAFSLLVFKEYQPEEWMKPYYKELKEILAKYNGLVRADYTDSSYKTMEEHFKIGKDGDYIEHIKYLIDSGKTPDIPDLEAWFKQKIEFGRAGFDLLVKTSSENKDLDLSKLQAVYDSIGKQEQYTAESWAKFQKDAGYWLTEAKRLLGGKDVDWSNIDQAYIDKISKGLQNAIDTILVKKDSSGNGSNNGVNNSNGNNQGGGK